MKKNKILIFAVPLMIILICVVVYQYGYRSIRAKTAFVKEEQDIKLKLLERYMALIAEKPLIEKQISLLKAGRKSDDSKLIEGQTSPLAAAALEGIIKDVVVAKKGIISSQRASKPEELGKFNVITVSIDAVLPDANALSEILYSIETRTPYLVVKELDIRARHIVSQKDLMVKMDISALTGTK
jgi:CBS domain-containing protein